MKARRILKQILTPIVVVVAVLYFVVDGIFLSLVRPLARRLAHLPIFARIDAWVRTLGPYPTLVLFLVPLAVLEPVKPVGFYLIGTGHIISGITLMAVGEVVKLTLVERLFHMSRDKLMTIRAFAVVYRFVMGWLDWLKALPAWQAVRRHAARLKALARRLIALVPAIAKR